METAPTLIPYASKAPLRQGMRLSTILTVFALAVFLDTPHVISQLIMMSGMPDVSASMVAYKVAVLICALGFGVAAAMMFAQKSFGVKLLLVLFAIRFVLTPVAMKFLITASLSRLSLGRNAALTSYFLLHISAMSAVLWLLWRASSYAGRNVIATSIPWDMLSRVLAWAIFVLGGCLALGSLTLYGQWWFETGKVNDAAYQLTEIVSQILLAVATGLVLLRKTWTWRLCLSAVILWGLSPLIADILLRLSYGGEFLNVKAALKNMSLLYLSMFMANIPAALLFTLLLVHPRIRGHLCGAMAR